MVVPRVERRGPAGLVTTAVTRAGMTATDESLLRGAARAALATGTAVSFRYGADAVRELDVVLDEKLSADRVAVGGLDRKDAVASGAPEKIAARGARVVLDRVGTEDDMHLTDAERAALVADLVRAGHTDRILLSVGATGVAKGHPATDLPYSHLLTAFVPLLSAHGVGDGDVRHILEANPRDLLAVR